MVNKYCSKCGAEMPEDAKFCTKCGKSFDEDTVTQSKKEHKVNKKTVYALLGTLGLLILIVFGSMFYSEYEEAREVRLAREKFVADSLEQVRKDSIKLAEQKEQERIEAEKMAQFREKICSLNDVVEFQNLMQGCSGLTNQAKSNYQEARPAIEAIAKRNGFKIYEYHYVNGDLGDGEMSSYCCFLYKKCSISTSETGYPTFTPTNKGLGCVLSDGEITVYDRDLYDELVRQIKERCEDKLFSEVEGDGEDSHYYSDGKYCYYIDCIGSGVYWVSIRKKTM